MVAGPSGVGKGTLIDMLMKDMDGQFGFSVSHATRSPRPGEVDGKSYHFVSVGDMEAARGSGAEHPTGDEHSSQIRPSLWPPQAPCRAGAFFAAGRRLDASTLDTR